ncbi:MAG TPA: hypothetical protein VFV99_03950 [Kofleriaceae bacterium]|nr:hypothetical protein [Kofleriaceae bacterium]
MRTALLLMVVLGGCVADAEDPPPVKTVAGGDVTLLDEQDTEMDVCALAAELPTEDICSLACDPPAMAARMVSDGMGEPGTCYQLYCALPDDAHVLVGVCLPP